MLPGRSERVVTKPLLALTLGDPCGVGAEVVVKALADPAIAALAHVAIVGSIETLRAATAVAGQTDLELRLIDSVDEAGEPGVLSVLRNDDADSSFPVGEQSREAGAASHAWVETATEMALAQRVDAIVTAPVNKGSWRMAASPDIGHQEVFRRLSGAETVATMLVSGVLRCVHLSTHLSLADAAAAVTQARVLRYIELTDAAFRSWGVESPRIGVAALNPHGSDGGLIGDTEAREIAPAVAAAAAAGIDAQGPVPADSVFNQAIAGQFDVVLVMYHDQGHIAIKVHGFEESVSVNLGLPFVRTSVDHGTAFDIAGRGEADATSMAEAIKLAVRLAERRGLF